MGRFLVLVAIVGVVAWLLRRALTNPRRSGRSAGPPAAGPAPELVRCAHCGVHLPRADAHPMSGAFYCSDEHAARGPGEPS